MIWSGIFFLAAIAAVRASPAGRFDLVQTTADSMTFNFDVTLDTKETICFNLTDMIDLSQSVSPSVDVNVITSNPDHAMYDISFNFFPARQVIGGVPSYTLYPNSTKIADYSPQSYWSKYRGVCGSNTLSVPTLKSFDEICIANTCSAGTCLDSNTFKGQITIHGYTTTQSLSPHPTVASCGNPTVGLLQYVGYFSTSTVMNFLVTGNNSGICKTFNPSYTVGNTPYAIETNLTFDNGGQTNHLGITFTYPDNSVKTYMPFTYSATPSNTQCMGAYSSVSDLAPGWTSVCVKNLCNSGSSCNYETYTGTLTIFGQHIDDPVDWIGQVPQTCTEVIYAPTYAPTKDPKVTEGKIAAIILVSVFGIIAFVIGVWAIVVGFRSKFLFTLIFFFSFIFGYPYLMYPSE